MKTLTFSFKGLECPLQVIEITNDCNLKKKQKQKAPTSFIKGKLYMIYFHQFVPVF